MSIERPVVFDCEGDRLVGVLHEGRGGASTGIVIVVGGPQYRVGSHRQFVVMARRFASAGVPVLRFDVQGMGDSEGTFRSFESLDPDINAAIDAFCEHSTGVSNVVLLGLCDGASASLIYASSDPRVCGLVLMNPWVRTTQGEAKAYLRHYYLQRLLQKSFWRKVMSGEFAPVRSVTDFIKSLRTARAPTSNTTEHFLERMFSGWKSFRLPVLLGISGRDLTAQEFVGLCSTDHRWRSLMEDDLCLRVDCPDSDHTMSDERSLLAFCDQCIQWLGTIP